MRILLVDDNTAMRAFIRGIVSEFCQDIVECKDGKTAVEMYAARKPDAVLMDIHMPGMNGIQATEAIKRQDPDAVILMVTNYEEEVLKTRALNAGAAEYILKEDLAVLKLALSRHVTDSHRKTDYN